VNLALFFWGVGELLSLGDNTKSNATHWKDFFVGDKMTQSHHNTSWEKIKNKKSSDLDNKFQHLT
jgi:hypothetical protein